MFLVNVEVGKNKNAAGQGSKIFELIVLVYLNLISSNIEN